MQGAIDWSSVTNLAKGASVTVSSNSGAAGTIIDNNDGSRWQAATSTHSTTSDWVLIDLGESKTFSDIEIKWEASHCSKYSVYLSDTAIPYADADANGTACRVIDADWLATAVPAVTGGDASLANYTELLSLSSPRTARYILVYNNEYNGYGSAYGMSIFELRVANIQGRNSVDGIKLAQNGNAVAGVGSVEVTATPVNKLGEAMSLDLISNLRLTCNSPAVKIVDNGGGNFSVSASAAGTYRLQASAMVVATNQEITATLDMSVDFNWDRVENCALGKTVYGRTKADAALANPPANAVDADAASYYQYNGEWGGGDSWVIIDLGQEHMVEGMGVKYVNLGTPGRCVFGYAKELPAIMSKIETEGTDYVWPTAQAGAEWTYTPGMARKTEGYTSYAWSKPVEARYIMVRDADNPGGKPCFGDIKVKGVAIVNSVPTNINIVFEKGGLVVGETNTISGVVVDQYGKAVENVVPTFTVSGAAYENGVVTATEPGMVAVTATYGDITVTRNFAVADQNDYCLDGAVVTTSGTGNVKNAVDGGKVITARGGDFQLAPNESAGAHDHWFTVELAKPYDLDLIACLWEGACPKDYDVYLGTSESDMTLYYSERNKEGMKSHSDRFSGKEMKDIKFITVRTLSNATGYGLKLFDIKAYGKNLVKVITTSVSVTSSENFIITEQTITLNGAVLDQFGVAIPENTVTYTCESPYATISDNKFTAQRVGDYDVVATYGDLTSKIKISVIAAAESRLKANDLYSEVYYNGEYQVVNIFNNQEITITKVPSTVAVGFRYILDFDMLTIRWEAAAPSDYTVEALYADDSEGTILSVSDRKFVAGLNPTDKIIDSSLAYKADESIATANLKRIKQIKLKLNAKDHPYNLRLFGLNAYGVDSGVLSAVNTVTESEKPVDVYNLQGIKVCTLEAGQNPADQLPKGVYIIGNRKVAVK